MLKNYFHLSAPEAAVHLIKAAARAIAGLIIIPEDALRDCAGWSEKRKRKSKSKRKKAENV